MKELSIEEKAEAYDKALDRAKKWYNAPNIDKMPTYGNRIIEQIFPELREDEYDRGYYDALKWVYEHTGGDNYKLSVKAKMQEFIKG